jgi:exopolysaccharide biosynthesis polyprenyl glycosylphosphotransferase
MSYISRNSAPAPRLWRLALRPPMSWFGSIVGRVDTTRVVARGLVASRQPRAENLHDAVASRMARPRHGREGRALIDDGRPVESDPCLAPGGIAHLAKRSFDLALATIALLALSPLFAAVALAIKIDSPGPVVFRQRRRGFGDREFTILKFRTMRVLESEGEIVQARRNDDRVTRVGHWLRRTSLDELPQLLNIARGDMSLVGPRPHAIWHDDRYRTLIDNYPARHRVRPGLTGAAQVMGLRGETPVLASMERRVERDLWYIRNWSFALDVKILFQTCGALLRHEAY